MKGVHHALTNGEKIRAPASIVRTAGGWSLHHIVLDQVTEVHIPHELWPATTRRWQPAQMMTVFKQASSLACAPSVSPGMLDVMLRLLSGRLLFPNFMTLSRTISVAARQFTHQRTCVSQPGFYRNVYLRGFALPHATTIPLQLLTRRDLLRFQANCRIPSALINPACYPPDHMSRLS